MGKTTGPVVRSLLACAVIASSMLVLVPAPAHADVCTGHSQPGATITVGGTPVRVPAIEVQVCHDVLATWLVGTPRVVTSGYPCQTSCLAIMMDYPPATYPDQDVTVTYSIDGSSSSRNVQLPIGNSTPDDSCLFGVGFPAPPRSNCFISIDPDD